ncbi:MULTISPECIES: hypothetical protein [unclassified Mycolicibacterium]|uniref:hypothetical protein n=1 Tax=unclassified Mycolicibacterium TaxID=2636767 RepID=UPI00130CE366|nr:MULTISPECIES: hypothetical protein [unclassified Mycolicibacterium]MUL82522.1 hypothetical protein [Mycolicibacterium sp. CBMA 329]MUL91346.1 hypothetical protein [Mycolicibacterium sp. CBMA 331]MUM01469.1 hypothetical protein [Mycolicibacterium sp. CBMA 334]MUM29984.1 hypothetical protein [Mycolicibacterium sp. CBMA 295]MUM41770.1 hypothetical protein [Mycolicibacterium sp. CBMA 247]
MKRVMAAGFLLVILAEAVAVVSPDRRAVAWTAGVALAVLLIAMRWSLREDGAGRAGQPATDDAAELLAQWKSGTEILIRRADSTRLQWDRHLRPRLAREFSAATRHRQAADPAAFRETGRMLFGPQLWQWVDPDNVASRVASQAQSGLASGHPDDPGPGRAILGEILQRLEQL